MNWLVSLLGLLGLLTFVFSLFTERIGYEVAVVGLLMFVVSLLVYAARRYL